MFRPLEKSRRKCAPTKRVGGRNCLAVTRAAPVDWSKPAEEPQPLELRPMTVPAPGIMNYFAALLGLNGRKMPAYKAPPKRRKFEMVARLGLVGKARGER